MNEVDDSWNPIFPHENIELFKANAERSNPSIVYELGQFAVFLKLHTQIAKTLDADACEKAFVAANGVAAAEILADKYRFGDFVNDLGYSAPGSVLIEPGQTGENGTRYCELVAALDTECPQRFCKPLYSTRGRGIHLAQTPEEALAFAVKQNEPYLLQTFEFPQRDWRYILHRDAFQLSNSELPGWRIASQKVRPTVVGDGSKSILQLVQEHNKMPMRSKRGYIKHHADALKVIPTQGEVVELMQSANVAQGAYPQMGTAMEIHNLDRFMKRFLWDIETALGAQLGTVCVDLGVKDDALSEVYDFEKIKRCIVFYEHQMPFDILYDMPPDTSWSALDKIIPGPLRVKYMQRKVQWNLMRSVVRSGRYIREHEV